MITATMNLNWRGSHKRLLVNIRPRNKPNYVFPPAYNYSQHKHSWEIVLEKANNRTLTGNHSALHAKNDFFKKSRVLTEMKAKTTVQNHSFTTVIVISSMFLFFTISLTVAVIVFCRKRNTVFALQKCEEEDDADDEQEYELDDLNTDVEYPSEYESESRRQSHQTVESPIHQPLMPCALGAPGTYDSDPENDYSQHLLHPSGDNKHYNYSSTAGHDQRGMYQRMVVTAVLENQHLQRETSEQQQQQSGSRTTIRDKIQKKYHDFAHLTHTDIESEFSAYPMTGNPPVISISYADDPPSYDSLSYHSPSEEISCVSQNTPYHKIPFVELTEIPVREQCNSCKSCNVFVTIPDSASALPQATDSSVLFVNLPPKSTRTSTSSLSTASCSTSSSLSSIESNHATDGLAVSQSMSLPATPLEPPSAVVGQRLATSSNQWSSCASISTTLDTATEAASWSDLQHESPQPARRPCSISFTRESGIADLVSPTTVMTPISPPPGFRNDDCFITPSSTDDSGVMVATT